MPSHRSYTYFLTHRFDQCVICIQLYFLVCCDVTFEPLKLLEASECDESFDCVISLTSFILAEVAAAGGAVLFDAKPIGACIPSSVGVDAASIPLPDEPNGKIFFENSGETSC